jgi:hypothetical protein
MHILIVLIDVKRSKKHFTRTSGDLRTFRVSLVRGGPLVLSLSRNFAEDAITVLETEARETAVLNPIACAKPCFASRVGLHRWNLYSYNGELSIDWLGRISLRSCCEIS